MNLGRIRRSKSYQIYEQHCKLELNSHETKSNPVTIFELCAVMLFVHLLKRHLKNKEIILKSREKTN